VLKASEARGAGILDEVLTNEPVADAILTARQAPKRLLSKLPVPIGDPMAEESTARRVLAKAKGVPAVAEAVRIIRAARTMSFEDAVAAERAAFLELRGSDEAAALRHVFFAEREAVRVPGLEGIAARPIRRVGVIGAGTMGAAIASALADVGLAVDLVERDEASAEEGKQRVSVLYDRQVKASRLDIPAAAARLDRIAASADWSRLGRRHRGSLRGSRGQDRHLPASRRGGEARRPPRHQHVLPRPRRHCRRDLATG
jgi:3-hydroxyacyl-CoA dehydrogenase